MQGCFQLCLETVLGNGDPGAATFLQEGCRELKDALGLEQLLLLPLGGAPGMFVGTGAETAIYWDDKEEGAVTAVERIETVTVPQLPPVPTVPLKQPVSLPPAKQTPVRVSGSSLATSAGRHGGPFIETRPARVVGCALLSDACGSQVQLVMYPTGRWVVVFAVPARVGREVQRGSPCPGSG